MKLIRKLGTRKSKNGKGINSWAVFWCDFCLQEVEKTLSSGKEAKSCGCMQYKLASKSKTGQKRTYEQKQNISKALKGKKKSEEHIKNMSKVQKGKKASKETREKQSEAHKGREVWNTGLTKETSESVNKISLANTGKIRTEEQRRKQSEKQKGRKPTEEARQKMSKALKGKYIGALSSNWNNGSSFEPYSPEFNKPLKQSIMERDNYCCQNPNCEHKSNILNIHHIDYNKKNSKSENLITLCNSCHTKTNGKNNRKYFIEFYQNIIINIL